MLFWFGNSQKVIEIMFVRNDGKRYFTRLGIVIFSLFLVTGCSQKQAAVTTTYYPEEETEEEEVDISEYPVITLKQESFTVTTGAKFTDSNIVASVKDSKGNMIFRVNKIPDTNKSGKYSSSWYVVDTGGVDTSKNGDYQASVMASDEVGHITTVTFTVNVTNGMAKKTYNPATDAKPFYTYTSKPETSSDSQSTSTPTPESEPKSTPTPTPIPTPQSTPTPEPTVEPTLEPSVDPTVEPTVEPVVTPETTPTPDLNESPASENP